MKTVNLKNGEAVTVRPWQESDIPKLYQLMQEVSKEGQVMMGGQLPFGLEQLYQQLYYTSPEAHQSYVAVSGDNQILGWIHCDRSTVPWMGHNAYVWMGVANPNRGQGIGKALLQEAFSWAAAHGIERVELGVRGSNKNALALYQKMGFHEEGRKLRAIKTEQGYDDDIWLGVFLDSKGAPKQLKASATTKKQSSRTKASKTKRV